MRVFSNTAISLDGRINTRDDLPPALGTPQDLRRMKQLRAQADAVLVGGATFRHWPIASLPEPEALVGRTTPFWNVIVTRSFQLTPRESFLAETRIRPLFLTVAGHAPPSFPAEIEVYPGNDIPVPWILETLSRRGIRNLLVEAGGDLLFQFLAADAIDDLYVTLCPLLIGGAQTASLVDGPGFSLAAMRRLRLQQVEQIGDELYLHYQLPRSPQAAE